MKYPSRAYGRRFMSDKDLGTSDRRCVQKVELPKPTIGRCVSSEFVHGQGVVRHSLDEKYLKYFQNISAGNIQEKF
jgi:hypothetical protein